MSDENLIPATSSDPAPGEPGGSGDLGFMERAILIFSDPPRVFASLRDRPRFVGAFFFVLIFSLAAGQATMPLAQQAQEDFMRKMDLSEEQLQRAMVRVERMTTPSGRIQAMIWMFIGMGAWVSLVAAAFLLGGNFLMGGAAKFSQMLAVTLHAWIPYAVAGSVVKVPLMLAKGSVLVATSLAVLLPSDRWMSPLGVVLGSIDVFVIWMLALLVTGLSILYGWPKGKATGLVVGLYAIFVLLGVAVSLLFASLIPSR